MKLEEEFQQLNQKENRNAFENNLLNHLHDRCNRLWKKIATRSGAGPFMQFLYDENITGKVKSNAR